MATEKTSKKIYEGEGRWEAHNLTNNKNKLQTSKYKWMIKKLKILHSLKI
jgi:hypothetical protein